MAAFMAEMDALVVTTAESGAVGKLMSGRCDGSMIFDLVSALAAVLAAIPPVAE
jgi:hypothetical protein